MKHAHSFQFFAFSISTHTWIGPYVSRADDGVFYDAPNMCGIREFHAHFEAVLRVFFFVVVSMCAVNGGPYSKRKDGANVAVGRTNFRNRKHAFASQISCDGPRRRRTLAVSLSIRHIFEMNCVYAILLHAYLSRAHFLYVSSLTFTRRRLHCKLPIKSITIEKRLH